MRFPHRSQAALALVAALAACASDGANEGGSPRAGAASEAEGTPLATVGETVITTADVERRLAGLSPYERARYASYEQRRELLDNMIRFEVLAQEAQRRGFDQHPDVVRTVKELMIQRMMEARLAELDPSAIPLDELRAFYDDRADEFHRAEEVRASVIVVDDPGRAEELAREAKDASPGRFRQLVEAHSVDPATRARGGDLRYFTRETDAVPAVVIDAAFAAEAGEIAGPIAVEADGAETYFIIMRTGHRPMVEHSFEDSLPQIRNRVYRQQRTEAQARFIEELRETAEIEVREGALDAIEIPPSGGRAAEPAPAETHR